MAGGREEGPSGCSHAGYNLDDSIFFIANTLSKASCQEMVLREWPLNQLLSTPGNSLEIQIAGPHLRPTEWEILEVESRNLGFNHLFRRF